MKVQVKADFFSNELSPSMTHMYGRDKLANFPLFQGGYINFGYWQDIEYTARRLTPIDRINSSKNLYLHVFDQLAIRREQRIIEIGSGHGLGVEVLVTQYGAQNITGLDITAEHIVIAETKHAALLQANPHTYFLQADAQDMPFPDASFDCLFSIEALQHLVDFAKFAQEAWRILSVNGQLAITTFFKNQLHNDNALAKFIPDVDKSIGMGPYIQDALQAFTRAGFKNVQHYSIGEHVWKGFDTWMEQTPSLTSNWGRNWLKAYEAGLLDYYVILANKP